MLHVRSDRVDTAGASARTPRASRHGFPVMVAAFAAHGPGGDVALAYPWHGKLPGKLLTGSRMKRSTTILALTALCLAVFAQALGSARQKSLTFDELVYIQVGYS